MIYITLKKESQGNILVGSFFYVYDVLPFVATMTRKQKNVMITGADINRDEVYE